MNIYKVTFANNEITGCQLADQRFDHDSEYYYEYKGQIKYAMVMERSAEAAQKTAKSLIAAIQQRNKLFLHTMSAAA